MPSFAVISPRIVFQRAMKEKRILFQKQVAAAVEEERKLKLEKRREESLKLKVEEHEIREYKRGIKARLMDIDRNVATKVDHLVGQKNRSTAGVHGVGNGVGASTAKTAKTTKTGRRKPGQKAEPKVTPASIRRDAMRDIRAARLRNFLKARQQESLDRQSRLLFLYQSAKNFVTYKNMSDKIDHVLLNKTLSTSQPYTRELDFKGLDMTKRITNGKRAFVLKDILAGRYLNNDDLGTAKKAVEKVDLSIEAKIQAFKAKLKAASNQVTVDGSQSKSGKTVTNAPAKK